VSLLGQGNYQPMTYQRKILVEVSSRLLMLDLSQSLHPMTLMTGLNAIYLLWRMTNHVIEKLLGPQCGRRRAYSGRLHLRSNRKSTSNRSRVKIASALPMYT
jgi:hypothetical protein